MTLTDQLPMWLSLGLTIVGFFFSLLLVRLAYGGVLFVFTVIMTIGILLFGAHHLVEMLVRRHILISEGLEALSSLIFLIGTVYLAYRLKRIIYGP